VWDADAGTELLELPRSGGCNFNAAWSPTVPGVFATASFDGKVQLRILMTVLTTFLLVRHKQYGIRPIRCELDRCM
jgi:hypothetical protein